MIGLTVIVVGDLAEIFGCIVGLNPDVRQDQPDITAQPDVNFVSSDHGHHLRGPRDLSARHLRQQDCGHLGEDGGQFHRKRYGQQLGERVYGSGNTLDYSLNLP